MTAAAPHPRTERALHPPPRRVVAIVSGGLDSTVLAYWFATRDSELRLLSFDYGQRHRYVRKTRLAGFAPLLPSKQRACAAPGHEDRHN
jgi:7-cyano-7-deazaguanine synthase